MNKITYNPIGIVHSPFKELKGTPIQPVGAKGIKGTIEIFPKYAEGLKDIESFSYIILIYHFNLSKKHTLKVKPFMDNNDHGVFATRAPSRPNPIGISIVSLVKVEKNIIHIKDIDIIDGTPLLDVKPYVPNFDTKKAKKIGWLKEKVHKLPTSKDDGRFAKLKGGE